MDNPAQPANIMVVTRSQSQLLPQDNGAIGVDPALGFGGCGCGSNAGLVSGSESESESGSDSMSASAPPSVVAPPTRQAVARGSAHTAPTPLCGRKRRRSEEPLPDFRVDVRHRFRFTAGEESDSDDDCDGDSDHESARYGLWRPVSRVIFNCVVHTVAVGVVAIAGVTLLGFYLERIDALSEEM